jgi:calcineurin-like phosphoesterase family protein
VAYDRRYGGWPKDRSLVTDEDVAWHDDMLAENWDRVVKPNDTVWVLGDLIANPKSLDAALHWIMLRPGFKHLILGNHDPAHSMNRDSHKWLWRYNDAFNSVQQSARRRINGVEVLMSHFPYKGDGDSKEEDRDVQWRLRNEGVPILHGHTHSKEVITFASMERFGVPTEEKVPQINVGVDAWNFLPVEMGTVSEVLGEALDKDYRFGGSVDSV